jgi:hypothetical protein
MSKNRGSQFVTLTVMLLALAATEVRGQSKQEAVGDKATPPAMEKEAAPVTARTSQMPLPAAPSQLGFAGPSLPTGNPATEPMAPPWANTSGFTPPAPGLPAGPMAAYGPMPANHSLPPMYQPAAYGPPPGAPNSVYPVVFEEEPYSAPQPLPMGPAEPMTGPYMGEPFGYDAGGYVEGPPGPGVLGSMCAYLPSVLPYGEGGCCAPRWFDISAEYVYLNRDNTGRRVNFTSDGLLGNIILSSDSLDFDPQGGVRLTGALQVWAGGTVELGYLGLINWSTSSSVVDPTDDLWGPFTQFGAILPPIDEVDRARYHGISYSSSIDSFELNFRKRWTGPNCRLQGSWMAGVRYVYLLEDFEFFTQGGGNPSRGSMDYDIRTMNSLTGFQLGGDLWTCIIPGISFGGMLNAGVYGNAAAQRTHILATTSAGLNLTKEETDEHEAASLIAEGGLMLIYRTSPHWTVKGGYTFLYFDGVALAPENFNSIDPAVRPGTFVNDNGHAFYHGFTGGIEWMW